ncbi:MAG: penicillin-binding protein activator [Alphaproteobacteria bacterium]|nr:penicillin-binding protein activator [Alphaproteobacteria bacterium]
MLRSFAPCPSTNRAPGPRSAGWLAMAVAALTLGACAGAFKPSTSPPPEPAKPAASRTTTTGKLKVALLVPLSGRSRAIGTSMMEAAELAIFDGAGRDVALLPYDTGDSPEQAVAAVQKAAKDGAVIVLGPLFGASASAAAPAARAAKLEMVSFSNDESVAQPGVYPMGLDVQTQVRRVADYALSRGIRRFAAFTPATAYGAQATEALRETVTPRGGTLVVAERFGFAGGNLSGNASRIVDMVAAEGNGRTAVLLPASGPPLAAATDALGVTNPDAKKPQLIGTGIWDTPDIAKEESLLGAWFAAPDPALRAAFERKYAAVHGRPPHRLATLAYDAVNMAATLARSRPGGDFSALAVTDPGGFRGLDGLFRFRQDGRVERALAVLEIGKERVRVVEPAPSSLDRPSN